MDAGADHIYMDTVDTSLRLGIDALRELGVGVYHAQRSARTFRRHDEEAKVDLARLRHDRDAYVSRARERIRDLEHTLLAELNEPDHSLDEAWDTESVRREFGTGSPAD
jgi:glutathione-regulated potassium-efflux system protein KefB